MGTILGGASFKTYSLTKHDNEARELFLKKRYDKNKRLQLIHQPLSGSNTVFSLCHNNAIYNNLKIYKNEFSENLDSSPVFTTKGVGITFHNKLEMNENKVFNKIWCSTEITFDKKLLNLNNIKILFKEVNNKTLTINDFNKLASMTSNLPFNLTRYEEKTICDGNEYYGIIHNAEVKAIGYHKKDIENYLVVHYPWANSYISKLLWLVTLFCIFASLLIFRENERKENK